MSIKITDLVPQSTIDEIKGLRKEMSGLLDDYTETAKELAKGLNIEVRTVGDLDKLEKLLAEKSKEAATTTERLNTVMARQSEVVANTTNTISRQLMERERLNKQMREEYRDGEKVRQLINDTSDSYEHQTRSMAKLELQIKANKKSLQDLEKHKSSFKSQDEYLERYAKLIAKGRELSLEKSQLSQLMKIEEKLNTDNAGSYNQLSHQLELLKKTYKDMSDSQRESDIGKEFERSIQDLDAYLKDTAADMGEFQRNVGNYAIAGRDGVVATESLVAVMNQEAQTTQDLVDQTKILEDAKLRLNKDDADYQTTLDSLNGKIEENKRKLSDVSDILNKDATSVAEAEAQNKRLQEALKHVDLTSADAQKRIKELNDKIAANTRVIRENTPAIQDQTKAMEQQKKANEGLAGNMLNLIGLNSRFGTSLRSLEGAGTGNLLDGLSTKTKAFGNTLMGLLSNPWVLAFLGISGVVAGFKWWYDYNKGMIEASRLTKNFTNLTGEAADKVTVDMQTLADSMGKGYDETIGAANTLVNQFGISWQEAMDIMEDGLIAGADMGGNMLSNIDKFSGSFKDAGVSASEFMAILAETRNGIFDEKALKSITDAGVRLRSLSKSTKAALEGIGISAKKMEKDLTSGNITMIEAIQQVSSKLEELPPNCQQVGDVMKNVFGRKSAMAGEEVVKSIKDINDNLDVQKERMGKLGKVNEENIDAQRKLNETIASVFKVAGTGFEEMTTKAKTFVAKGITAIINGCVDIVNWFIELYNKSYAVRVAVNYIVLAFKNVWTVSKFVIKQTIDGFKSLGEIIEGVLTMNLDKIKSGYQKGLKAFKDDFIVMVKEIKTDADKAVREIAEGSMNKVSVGLESGGEVSSGGGKGKKPKNPGMKEDANAKKAAAKKAKEAEKAAKEQLKTLLKLEESKIAALEEGHEKELALIRLKFKKKMAEIKGDSQAEKDLRLQLSIEMADEIGDCELKYQQNLSRINLENRLACVEEGSRDELDLRLAQLEAQRAQEIKEAEKTGADKHLINEKFNKKRQEMTESYGSVQIQKAQEEFAAESAIADNAYNHQLNKLNAKYAEELQAAGTNQAAREKATKKHEESVARLTETYAIQRADASVAMLEETLKNENLSAKDRAKLEDDLAKAKIASEKAVTDATIAENKRQVADDEAATQKRIANAQKWLQVVSDSLNAVNGLASAIYDAKIERVEEEQEANEEAGEAEQERISELVEKNVITEEEGEARKRAAEAQTAKKTEELEKKKQQLKHRQAVWDKANSIAQIGISTALAIMQIHASIPPPASYVFQAITAALGAVQLATAIATPIPKYAKGTKDHPGGPAIVGDGGRQEVVMFNGSAWLTPDKPTLMDIPEGASVFPSVKDFELGPSELAKLPPAAYMTAPKSYDDSRLRSDVKELRRGITEISQLIRRQTKQMHTDAYLAEYEIYKSKI